MSHFAKLVRVVCLTMLVAAANLHAGEIHETVKAGDLDKVQTLIEADPTLLESKDQWDHTPLHIACWEVQVAGGEYRSYGGTKI